MKNAILTAFFFPIMMMFSQTNGDEHVGLHNVDLENTTITNPVVGSILYHSTKKKVYVYTGLSWEPVGSSDADAIIGNEITGITSGNTSLTRSGSGTESAPFTLAVATNGITNTELANDAVELENIKDGTAQGQLMQWDAVANQWVLATSYKHIAICEFVRSEPVLNGTGRIMFSVPSDLDGYKTKELTCTIQNTNEYTGTVSVNLIHWRSSTENATTITGASINTASANSATATITETALAQGDLLYLDISGSTVTNAPEGLSCTIKLTP